MDLNELSSKEREEVMQEVQFMKKYRSLFQFGTFYRLRSPFETNETIWMVVSSQKDVAIVGYYRPLQQVNVQYNRVKLLGLDPHKNIMCLFMT